MTSRILLALAATLTLACVRVDTLPLAPGAGKQLANREVATTQRAKPDFSAMTAGKAAFGILGAAAMISAGNDIIRENEVEDPATAIAADLSGTLAQTFQTKTTKVVVGTAATDVKDVCAAGAEADLILDVRTINWMFGYYPTNWNHYRVLYSAHIRLIDRKAGKVLTEAMVNWNSGEEAKAPTKEELLENKAAKLKAMLKQAGVDSVAYFKKVALGL